MIECLERRYAPELSQILKLFLGAKRLFSKNSIVLDLGDSIVKIDTKERIARELSFMLAFGRHINVPRLIRKRYFSDLAFIQMEKARVRGHFESVDSVLIHKRLIEAAKQNMVRGDANDVRGSFHKNFTIMLGKKAFNSLIEALYHAGRVKLYLTHGDLKGNILGSADDYSLIDFETAGYREIEYEVAILRYVDTSRISEKLCRLYYSNFNINEMKVDLYGLGLLNRKLSKISYNPAEIIRKPLYLIRILNIILALRRFMPRGNQE